METDWIARAVAILGLAIAIWNGWFQHRRAKMRIRVEPVLKKSIMLQGPVISTLLAIDVINDSAFEVEIREVGVVTTGGDKYELYGLQSVGGGTWRVILARSRGTFDANSRVATLYADQRLDSCYAKTAVGRVFKAPLLKRRWTLARQYKPLEPSS